MKTVYGLLLAAAVLMLPGCTLLSEERIKLRDLDFTVLSEEKIPAELMTIIEEKKSAPFQITYIENFDCAKRQILLYYFTPDDKDIYSIRIDGKEIYADYEKTTQFNYFKVEG